jgi:GT2 family glycosyltransferase
VVQAAWFLQQANRRRPPLPPHRFAVMDGTTIVIATRNRWPTLRRTIDQLRSDHTRVRVIIVDDCSDTRIGEREWSSAANVQFIRLAKRYGAAARNVGVSAARTPYVAFCDDDSWYVPGAIEAAEAIFEQYPRLALIAARVLVDGQRLDLTCRLMEQSVLASRRSLPGPPIAGFVACGALVRREAYLQVGGFHERYGVGGEEELLSWDLLAANWDLAYVERIEAHHYPVRVGNDPRRKRVQIRNRLWSVWLRRSLKRAVADTLQTAKTSWADPIARRGLVEALAGIGWVWRERRPVPAAVEGNLRLLEKTQTAGSFC